MPHVACPGRSVMRESSWREQEVQDRRLAVLDEERSRLAFAAQAAQAEAEAARREAAVQRRLVARLQQAAEARESADSAAGGSTQVVDLLQKRVKVLEAQNIKLRMQARASKEEEQVAAAEAAAAAAARRAQRGRGGAAGGASEEGSEEAADGGAPGAAGENDSPNLAEGSGSGAVGAGSLLDGNPVLERWAADKRLQKRVEALQAKLRVRESCGPAWGSGCRAGLHAFCFASSACHALGRIMRPSHLVVYTPCLHP